MGEGETVRRCLLFFVLAAFTACGGQGGGHVESEVPGPTGGTPQTSHQPTQEPSDPPPDGPSGATGGATGPSAATGATGASGASGDPELPQDGSWQHPFVVTTFPARLTGDTSTEGQAVEHVYTPCAPATREDGNELVYRVVLPEDGTLTVAVDDVAGDAVDVDVHLLDAADAAACLARANVSLSRVLQGGVDYFVVVDTWWNGQQAMAGPFELSLSFVPAQTPGAGGCPDGMTRVPSSVGEACMDRYEAPNIAGAVPLVMFDFNQAEAWCGARGKRLCYDDEWTKTCEGPAKNKYVYGNTQDHSKCNTGKLWRQYNQSTLNLWPKSVSTPSVPGKAEHFAAAAMHSANGAQAAAHVEALYQAEPAGAYPDCKNEYGVYDLNGSVEEWTRRRDGGSANFRGNLKGRFWVSEATRTCQQNITVHGDAFVFYEIGFRCCRDLH